jgi:hypothetical protein
MVEEVGIETTTWGEIWQWIVETTLQNIIVEELALMISDPMVQGMVLVMNDLENIQDLQNLKYMV